MSMNTKRDPIVLERRFVPSGSMVIKQGEEGNCAFLIQSGKVSIYTHKEEDNDDNEGQRIDLAEIGTGDIFGEMALLFDGPRTASAQALEDCNLIVITRQVFDNKMQKSDPTVRAMLAMLSKRIMSANNTVMNKKSSFKDLTETAHIIYENIAQTLPREQQRTLENAVLPKLDSFLQSIRTFQERYESEGKVTES